MKPVCSFDGCQNTIHARGLCNSHYKQFRLTGATSPVNARPDVKQWLRDHVDYEGVDCLIWPFHRGRNGYAAMRGGLAYRYMCELVNGPPPFAKAEAAHSCGKGHEGCVNPKHLRWATRKENAADMVAHGTRKHGNQLPWAKLTPEDVREIRATHKKRASPVQLMAKYNISRKTFYDVINRVSWRHA